MSEEDYAEFKDGIREGLSSGTGLETSGVQFFPDPHCFPGSSEELSRRNLSLLSTGLSW